MARGRAPLITLVTDSVWVPERELIERLERIGRLGAEAGSRVAVQLRSPALSSRELLASGRRIRHATSRMGMRLVVNDRIDLALLLGADGVHLGRRSPSIADARKLLPQSSVVSVSCHTVDEVVAAARAGATFCSLSPILTSPGKGAPLGIDALGAARSRLEAESLDIGLVALGGLDSTSAPLALAAGADGVATIRGEIDPRLLLTRRSFEDVGRPSDQDLTPRR